jgi:hypothetical protein
LLRCLLYKTGSFDGFDLVCPGCDFLDIVAAATNIFSTKIIR